MSSTMDGGTPGDDGVMRRRLCQVLQRRYYAVRPDESTHNNLQWDTIHRTPSHGSPSKTQTVPEA